MRNFSRRLLVACIVSAVASSCERQRPPSKLAATKAEIPGNLLRGATGIRKQIRDEILTELERATEESIKTASLSAAVLWDGGDVGDVIHIWWIEDLPTVNALAFRSTPESGWSFLPLPADQLATLKECEAKHSVLYSLTLPVNELDSAVRAKVARGGEVCLARDGQVTGRTTRLAVAK
jgi:hypothetical protein